MSKQNSIPINLKTFQQKIEIYYKAVGIINIADVDCVALDGRLGTQNAKKKTA